ncbi:MAG: PadR family transcriptional regulator [Actinomycetota bacterium]
MHTEHPRTEHEYDDNNDERSRRGGGRRGRRSNRMKNKGRHGKHGRGFGPGPGHHGPPHRARRGAVAQSILLLLDEQPMHGYEIIEELENRSDGAWRPSPGSIYPALRRMEGRGLVTGEDGDDGKRIYSITEDGHGRVADRDPDAPPPWEQFAEQGPSLRPLVMETMSQVRQIGRFGNAEQRQRAIDILTTAKADLYAVMAEQADASDEADGTDEA